MNGLLAQTNAYIRDAERQHRDQKARQDQVRRPIQLIDRLLQELEEMNRERSLAADLALVRLVQPFIPHSDFDEKYDISA